VSSTDDARGWDAQIAPVQDEKNSTVATALLALVMTIYILGGRWSFVRLIDPTISHRADLAKVLNFDVALYEIRPMMLLCAMALLNVIGVKPIERRSSEVLWPIIMFLAWFTATTLWTVPSANYPGKLLDITYFVIGLFCVAHALSIPKFLDYFLIATMGALTVLAFIGLKNYLMGGGEEAAQLEGLVDTTRLSVLGGGPNTFGRQMGALFILCVARYLSGPKAIEAVIVAGLALLALALAVLTGSRGALLATVGATGVLLLGIGVSPRALGAAALATLLVGIVAGAALADSVMGMEFIQKRWMDATFSSGYVSGRDTLAEAAIELWLTSPVIGTGLNSFAELNVWGGFYAHNLVLETAQESGLIGILFLGIALVGFFRRIDLKASKASAATIAVTFLWFMGTMTSGDLYDSRNFFIFMLLAAHASARN